MVRLLDEVWSADCRRRDVWLLDDRLVSDRLLVVLLRVVDDDVRLPDERLPDDVRLPDDDRLLAAVFVVLSVDSEALSSFRTGDH